jgi:single-strand DNA-binding protein
MASVNKVILIGNLGGDPEVKYLQNDSVVANFSVATTEKYKGKNGEPIEQTEWFRVEVWDSLAKIAEQYLRKGNPVYIEGKLRTEKYVDKTTNQEKQSIKVRATAMTLLGSKNSGDNDDSSSYSKPKNVSHNKPEVSDAIIGNGGEDDLPF